MAAVDEVRDLAEAVVHRRSLRLWDVEMGGRPGRAVVRVFVDADGGIDLDTIAEVSEELSRALDLRDPIQSRYTLEVSSPGLERRLRSLDHFRLCVGRRVVVKTKVPAVGDSNRIDGVVAAAGERAVTIDTGQADVEVRYEDIRSARTVFEWHGGQGSKVREGRESR
jgi:ribosome maturation factor RimP